MSSTTVETAPSLFRRLVQRWRELTAVPLSTEVGGVTAAQIAADVGLSVPDLEAVRQKGAAAAYPMYRRLASVGLDEAEIAQHEAAVLHDLQRVCSMCVDGRKCRHELAADPNNKAWQEYCPNMPTFEALDAEKREVAKG